MFYAFSFTLTLNFRNILSYIYFFAVKFITTKVNVTALHIFGTNVCSLAGWVYSFHDNKLFKNYYFNSQYVSDI